MVISGLLTPAPSILLTQHLIFSSAVYQLPQPASMSMALLNLPVPILLLLSQPTPHMQVSLLTTQARVISSRHHLLGSIDLLSNKTATSVLEQLLLIQNSKLLVELM